MDAHLEGPALARAYYRAIDGEDYEALADLLAPEFVHRRPDRTLRGREEFVSFMRDERPEQETVHEVAAIYASIEAEERNVAVEGELLHANGEPWFGFVDVFEVDGDRFVELRTYSR